MLKVIVKYEKVGYSKYLAHLEMVRLIERIMRRINIPFDFSGGYNPRPQIAFAAPLAVGVSSEAEYFEIKLTHRFDLDRLINIEPDYLPEGISIVNAAFSEDKTSIMAMVRSSSYLLRAPIEKFNEEQLRQKLNHFFAKEEVMWKKLRKKKPARDVNIAELINKAYLLNVKEGEAIFKLNCKTGSRGNLKPEIYLEKFYEFIDQPFDEKEVDIHRLEIYTLEDQKEVPIL